MKISVTETMFKDAFYHAGRQDNFSYEGLGILFNYFEDYEGECGDSIELDVVAICCEYCEMSCADVAENYSIDIDEDMSDEDIVEAVEEHLNDNTSICGKWENDEGVVYFVFSQF